MAINPDCMTCRFHDLAVMDVDEQPVVECHRYPPIVTFDGEAIARLFPQVAEGDWCGEWELQ